MYVFVFVFVCERESEVKWDGGMVRRRREGRHLGRGEAGKVREGKREAHSCYHSLITTNPKADLCMHVCESVSTCVLCGCVVGCVHIQYVFGMISMPTLFASQVKHIRI